MEHNLYTITCLFIYSVYSSIYCSIYNNALHDAHVRVRLHESERLLTDFACSARCTCKKGRVKVFNMLVSVGTRSCVLVQSASWLWVMYMYILKEVDGFFSLAHSVCVWCSSLSLSLCIRVCVCVCVCIAFFCTRSGHICVVCECVCASVCVCECERERVWERRGGERETGERDRLIGRELGNLWMYIVHATRVCVFAIIILLHVHCVLFYTCIYKVSQCSPTHTIVLFTCTCTCAWMSKS